MQRYLPLFLVAAGLAAPASAQQLNRRVLGHDAPRQVFVGYSWGNVEKEYDNDGNERNFGSTPTTATPGGSNATFQRMNFGGSANVMQTDNIGIYVGADVALARTDTEIGTVESSSDWKAQALSVEAGVRGIAYGFRVGYQHDLGTNPEFRSSTDYDVPNSDGASAIVLGANFYTPFQGLVLSGGADYFVTLNGEDEFKVNGNTVKVTRDPSDYINMYAGAAFRVRDVVEIGARASYLAKTVGGMETNLTGANAVIARSLGRSTEETGYGFSVIPYLTVSPRNMPLQLTVAAAATREYTPYGYTLSGNDMPVGRKGFTLGVRYGF